MTLRYKKIISSLQLGVLLVLPIFLLVLPKDYFDEGMQDLCLSKIFFNLECFGCGMTRAIMHLIHFDVTGAIFYNALSLIVLPLLIIVWIKWVVNRIKILKLKA